MGRTRTVRACYAHGMSTNTETAPTIKYLDELPPGKGTDHKLGIYIEAAHKRPGVWVEVAPEKDSKNNLAGGLRRYHSELEVKVRNKVCYIRVPAPEK